MSSPLEARPRPAVGPAWPALRWLLPAAALVFQLTTYAGYGFFRDELYYLANGRHLDFGYVDHPPLIGLVAAAIRTLLGESLFAVRIFPALCGAAVVAVTVELARVLGGGRFAQLLAGIAAFGAPLFIGHFGFLSLNAFDVLVWAIVWLLTARVLRGEDERLWIWIGVACGVGLENKISVLFLGLGIVVGLLACGRVGHLRSRWPWLGASVALLIFLPHVLWQVAHDWPTAEFIANARANKMLPHAPLDFLSAQVEMMGPLALPVWCGGLVFLLAAPSRRVFRPLGWAFVAVTVVMIAQKGKPYYLGPGFTLLFAAGGVAWERWSATFATRTVRASLLAVVVFGTVVALPLAKPILSVDAYLRYAERLGVGPSTDERKELGRLPQFFADMRGWRELAETVASVHAQLPPEDQRRARVFATNYGQAGAIDLFGPALGLAPSICGHNSYYLWGPGDWDGAVLLVIGTDGEVLKQAFKTVEFGALYSFPDCMPYENNKSIWIARDMIVPMEAFWSRVKNYD